jgi:cobalt-zinc-cadmium efflux system membrane fusion protein
MRSIFLRPAASGLRTKRTSSAASEILSAVGILATLALFGCQGSGAEAKRTAEPLRNEPTHTDLQLSAELISSGQVRIQPVIATTEQIRVRTSGKAGFNEERLSYLSSPLAGRVVEIRARPGERVDVGQTLAVIDSPDLGAASSEFIKARADMILAERSFTLAQELAAAKAMARKDFQKAEDESVKAKADLRRTRERLISLGMPSAELDGELDTLHVRSQLALKAPISGTLIERNLTLGQMVGGDATQRLFVIADLTTLWVTADIYEKDLALIRPGEEVSVEASAWPGQMFHGRLNYVGDTVDPNTRTVKVRLAVDNTDLHLKPEMFVTATVLSEGTTTVLSVPLAAVHGEGLSQPYVFVALGDTRFAPRPVTLGDKLNDRVVIASGLSNTEQVVTEGSILLKAEAARLANS